MIRSLFACCLLLFACSTPAPKAHKLKVAATAIPHAELLEFIKPDLAQKGIDLDILVIEDYQLPNRSLAEREIDANFFQHLPFLEEQVAQFNYCIVPFADIHIEPMGIYSDRLKNISSLPDRAKIAIPNDPTNEARALLLLQRAGLIKIAERGGINATLLDVTDNPKNLQVIEVDAAMLPRTLRDVDAAVIPTNFALESNLLPQKDAIFLEQGDSPYVNIIAIHCGDESREDLLELKALMTSQKMRQHILEKYKGEILPAF